MAIDASDTGVELIDVAWDAMEHAEPEKLGAINLDCLTWPETQDRRKMTLDIVYDRQSHPSSYT